MSALSSRVVAADLVKDFQLIQALPGVKAFEGWLESILIVQLDKLGFSPTLVGLIASGRSRTRCNER